MIVTSALHLYLYNGQEQHSFRHMLLSPMGIGSALAFSLSVIVIWPIGALLLYHVRVSCLYLFKSCLANCLFPTQLLLLNVTTIEQIRNQAHKSVEPKEPPPPNPFSHGSWRRNIVATLCRPIGLSWLDAHGLVTEDKREINPAFVISDEGVEGEGRNGQEA
jgi:palmitoyltransferase ZDHHC9/14/18